MLTSPVMWGHVGLVCRGGGWWEGVGGSGRERLRTTELAKLYYSNFSTLPIISVSVFHVVPS